MRSNITLPRSNARYTIPRRRASYIRAAYITAYKATLIGAFSRSASNELLAGSLIRTTIRTTMRVTIRVMILVTILATCAPASASYLTLEPPRPATPVQGSSSRKTVIDVRTSPAVYLPGPTIRIDVYSTNPVTSRVPEFLQQTIEQMLLMNDPRLRIAAPAATSIVFTITDLNVSSGVETRTRQVYQKIGDTTIIDSETGVAHTEDQYGYVDAPYRALVFEGRMNVKCEVTDTATGILLYSNSFQPIYTDAREAGAGSRAVSVDDLNIIYLKLADKAADLILSQLSPRVYAEIVALPSGRLKDASKLLESARWNEALTLLSGLPQFKDPKDDAYRFYCIGVAQEALAYQTLDAVERKAQLERAVDSYQRAAELKPKENMFWAPKNRAELELSQANGLVPQIEAFENAKKPSMNTAASRTTDLFRQVKSRMPPSVITVTNQTIVQWARAGRSTDYIVSSIKHAPATQFDLSEAERLKLRREGINNDVLKAMIEKQTGRRPSGLVKVLTTAASVALLLPLILR